MVSIVFSFEDETNGGNNLVVGTGKACYHDIVRNLSPALVHAGGSWIDCLLSSTLITPVSHDGPMEAME